MGTKSVFSEGYSVPWDGKRNGVDLPIATYYYVIELKDSGKVFNGTVTIKDDEKTNLHSFYTIDTIICKCKCLSILFIC